MKEQKKIVLIDDDDDDWLLFSEAVRRIDDSAIYHYFQDAIEAIRVLSARQVEDLPDFIFLDLNMPRMNGKECLIEIKRQTQLVHIPVIILSTSEKEEDIRYARKHGASYFVTKPYKLRLLEEALRLIIHGDSLGLTTELSKWVKPL